MTGSSEFPCWIGSDGTGALAFDWDEVRLVDVADDGSASICLEDGSEWSLVAVEFVPAAGDFFRKIAAVLLLQAAKAGKPTC